MEKAAIVLSLTVARAGAFAADAQRLNVALTRARHHLIIVGAAPVAQARPSTKPRPAPPHVVLAWLAENQAAFMQHTPQADAGLHDPEANNVVIN